MASVINGVRRRRAGLDNPLTSVQGHVDLTDEHKAQMTAAEFAIDGNWVDELGEVLDVLGLRGAS